MADNYDPDLAPGFQGNMVTSKTSLQGVTPFLTRVYKTDDLITDDFYSGIGTAIGDDIPIVFGRVMLTGQVTSAGALRSDLDPAQVKQVVQFVTSEGPTKGIAGVGDEKLKNVLINGVAAASGTNTVTNKEFGLKEVAGIATAAGVMAAVPWLKKVIGIDPETGTTIPDEVKSVLKGAKAKTPLNNVEGLGVSSTGRVADVIAWDKAQTKYTNRPLADVLKESGVGIDGFVVQQNGTTVRASVKTINIIGENVTVADVGGEGNAVNITIGAVNGGGTGSGGSGGSGSSATDPFTSSVVCQSTYFATPNGTVGRTYYLKRNGTNVSSFTPSTTSEADSVSIAAGLAQNANAATYDPSVVSLNNRGGVGTKPFDYVVSGSSHPSVTGEAKTTGYGALIVQNGSGCVCDTGTWTLVDSAGNVTPPITPSNPYDICAPRAPTLGKFLFEFASTNISLASAGAGYKVGDTLTLYLTNYLLQPLVIKVATVNGSGGILTWTQMSKGYATAASGTAIGQKWDSNSSPTTAASFTYSSNKVTGVEIVNGGANLNTLQIGSSTQAFPTIAFSVKSANTNVAGIFGNGKSEWVIFNTAQTTTDPGTPVVLAFT